MQTKTPFTKATPIQQHSNSGTNALQQHPPAYGVDVVDQLHTSSQRGNLPEPLKTNIEQLSGYLMDDVRVHYNSSKPVGLNALAYAQGTEIHLGPGQERHLAHEAWHVVQQKQGRVRPNLKLQGFQINDDPHLEREADQMGNNSKAYNWKGTLHRTKRQTNLNQNSKTEHTTSIQRKIGLEFQTTGDTNAKFKKAPRVRNDNPEPTDTPQNADMNNIMNQHNALGPRWSGKGLSHGEKTIFRGRGWELKYDYQDLEFVTDAFTEDIKGTGQLQAAVNDIQNTVGRWQARGNGAYFRPTEFGTHDFKAILPANIHAHPQATIGIKLEGLASFLLDIASADPATATQLGFSTASFRSKQRAELISMGPVMRLLKTHAQANSYSDQALGLIELVLTQIAGAHDTRINKSNLKDYTPFMHRTAFSELYNKLDGQGVTDYGLLVAQAKVQLPINGFQLTDPLFTAAGPSGNRKPSIAPNNTTVNDFLNVTLNGRDPFLEWFQGGLHSIAALTKQEPEEFQRFGMKSPTNIGKRGAGLFGKKRTGVLLEMRALRSSVALNEWGNIAMAIRYLVSKANQD